MKDRRWFCRTGVAALVLGAIAPRRAFARSADVAEDVETLLRHPAGARRIGRHVLASHRPSLGPDFLMERMTSLRRDLAMAGGREARRSLLRRRSVEDYAAGDIVLVDGWVLSRTEAHLCALVALA